MWLSTRWKFMDGDEGWSDYLRFIRLPQLKEVRSLDQALNKTVDDCGSYSVASFDDTREALAALPTVLTDRQYHMLFLDTENETLPDGATEWRLLGHDLSDETHTSSLLNCGPWTGKLARFVGRLNRYGLLGLKDAAKAKALLPAEWPGDPHAQVTIWALYEGPQR